MSHTALDPLVSEFTTAEEEEAYLRWLQAKVEASLRDPRPPVAHDAAAQVAQALQERRKKRAGG